MTTFMPAVVGFEEGGDYIHWFPFVILEFDEKRYSTEQVSTVSYLIEQQDVLEPELGSDGEPYTENDKVYYENFEEKPESLAKIEAAFAKNGVILKAHPAARMTYVAPRS